MKAAALIRKQIHKITQNVFCRGAYVKCRLAMYIAREIVGIGIGFGIYWPDH